ncbi:IS66 family insertion sequence element accessory protein TnpB [Variovorax flavidus]|uniref:IS66 family insertion sequence element accessory protein TnpB n=1 Tax=Variovorax flavidus TaxID=3053501 RepID=UPI0033656FC0
MASRAAAMIRIDALWLCTQPLDMRVMRAGAERLIAHVARALGSALADHGYVFANARATRLKLLVHGGIGMWCTARRLNTASPGRARRAATQLALPQGQLDALVVGNALGADARDERDHAVVGSQARMRACACRVYSSVPRPIAHPLFGAARGRQGVLARRTPTPNA